MRLIPRVAGFVYCLFVFSVILRLGLFIDHVTLKVERSRLHIMLLDIAVGCGDVPVACLVTGNDNALGIGKVTDAGILQRIELITVAPFQCVAHRLPTLVELVAAYMLFARLEVVAEDIAVARTLEDIEVEHQFDDDFVQTHISITMVLAESLGNEDGLILQADVSNLQITELAGTNERVVLHETRQEEGLVMLREILGHRLEHLRSEVLAELLPILWHHLDLLNRIVSDVLAGNHEFREAVEPATIIVTRSGRTLTVEKDPIDEVVAEGLIELISILEWGSTGGNILFEHIDPRVITLPCLLAIHAVDIIEIPLQAILEEYISTGIVGLNPRIPSLHELTAHYIDNLSSAPVAFSNTKFCTDAVLLTPHRVGGRVECIEIDIPLFAFVEFGVGVAYELGNITSLNFRAHFFNIFCRCVPSYKRCTSYNA